jgi:methionyl-tRNA formyltransferase
MKIVFMGTPAAAVPTLERLLADGHDIVAVYTQPDRPAGRGQKLVLSPVKEAALRRGFPLYQPEKIRTDEALRTFSGHAADVGVVVAYGRILPEEFLTAFPRGAINVHFSLLPKYRGAAPVNWAIANGEIETGVTTMQMDTGLDTGYILLQCTTSIGEEETAVELTERLAATGAELLSETLRDLDKISPRSQDDTHATYAPILKREDGLIDWHMSAKQIADRVRGFQPFPTAFTFSNSVRLTLWRTVGLHSSSDAAPGVVAAAGGDELIIGCGGNTALRIDEIQPEGKRRMLTREFLNGHRLEPGTVLGRR